MAVTYEPIASVSPSASSTVEFSSIPGTYTDLVLVYHLTHSSGDQNLRLRFNSDTASNYSFTQLYGTGSSAGSVQGSSQTNIRLDWYGYPGTSERAIGIIQIQSYANTNVNKTVLNASRRPGVGLDQTVGLWRSTNAITTVTILSNSGTVTGTASLYGIKAA